MNPRLAVWGRREGPHSESLRSLKRLSWPGGSPFSRALPLVFRAGGRYTVRVVRREGDPDAAHGLPVHLDAEGPGVRKGYQDALLEEARTERRSGGVRGQPRRDLA